MKGTEKVKAQKIVDKIQRGHFDDNDVDNLFMKLRSHSNGFWIFKEIADFVAHNDLRDQGLINTSLHSMYYIIKFFLEYTTQKIQLDISQPFPLWIKTLIKYQVDKVEESNLRENFNVTKDRLKSRIESCFKDTKSSKTTCLIQGKASVDTLNAIQYVMGFIVSKEAFSQHSLIEQLIKVIKINKIIIDEDAFRLQSNKITLCVLLLLHNAEFDFKGYKFGYCLIDAEKNSILLNTKFIDNDGNKVDLEQNFGSLRVNGHVVLNLNGREITIAHSVITTELMAEDWCAETLFSIEPLTDSPKYFCRHLRLEGDLSISEDFKLFRL